jgi:hypothetical protein
MWRSVEYCYTQFFPVVAEKGGWKRHLICMIHGNEQADTF